jgi:hypothetical protein
MAPDRSGRDAGWRDARALVHQREAIGRVFVEILTPDQVSAWVFGSGR